MWRWLHRLRHRFPIHLRQQDLDEEVQFHIECRAADIVRAGGSPAKALRQARLEFGPPERVKEDCRDARAGRFARELAADVRSAWRQMRRDRGLTLTILATMTLAIAITSTVFSLVHAVVLDPLPYPRHERLVMLWDTNAQTGLGLEQARKTASSMTAGDFVLWRDQSGLFDGLAAVALEGGSHLGGATRLTIADVDPNAEPARVALVTRAFFDITGVRPRLGRLFSVNEPAVLLQERYWHSRFQGREDVIGGTVWQGYGAGPEWSHELRVAGVMRREFALVSRGVDYLEPFDIDTRAAKYPESRGFVVIGRLKNGFFLEDARKRADAFSKIIEQRNPRRQPGWRVQLVPADEEAAGEFRPFMLALLAAVAVLILVLAVNTATLLLLKAVARAREIAVRNAMGASPGRVLRQFLTESTVLALLGGAGGLWLSTLILAWVRAHLPNPKTWGGSFMQAEALRVDGTVALFGILAALAVGAAFGLLPAWHASRTDVAESLKDAGPSLIGGRRRRVMSSSLLGSQFIFAAILLIGSGLLVRSAQALYRKGPGFDYGSRIQVGVRAADISLERIIQAGGATREAAHEAVSSSGEAYWMAREQFRRALLERAAALPGVRGVTSATAPIMSGGYWLGRFRPESAAQADDGTTEGLFMSVDWNYFAELRIPMLDGRTFGVDDRYGSLPVVVISEEIARRLWPGGSALGKRLQSINHPQKPWLTVIGVVVDTKMDGMEKPAVPVVYEPWAQNRWWHGSTALILRSDVDSLNVVTPLRQAISEIDKDAYIMRLHRVEDLVRDSAWRLNHAAELSAALAAISLVLAAIGIYGVLSHSVKQRTREIGLRVALGADATDLAVFVLRQAFVGVALGVAAGLVASSALVRSLRALLFGVEPLDPTTFAAAAGILVTAALVAAAIPLRRALRLEPLAALRHE
jgi:putative ABC transport system permease protein